MSQELPMLRTAMIFCDDLAGIRVWADVSPPVVALVPLVGLKPDANEYGFLLEFFCTSSRVQAVVIM